MAERQTLLSRNLGQAPTVQPTQSGAPQGAFGDSRGLISLGQGVAQSGDVMAQTALRYKQRQDQLRQENEVRLAQDARLKVEKEHGQALLGLRKIYEEKMANGDFAEGGASEWLDQNITQTKAQLDERLNEVTSSEPYRKHVPDTFAELNWLRGMDGLVLDANRHDGTARMQTRINDALDVAKMAFQGITAGNHNEVVATLVERSAWVDELKIPENAKKAIKKELASDAYARVAEGIHNRVAVPEELRRNPMFSPEQQGMLSALNAKITPKEDFSGVREAQQTFDKMVDDPALAYNPELQQTAHRAADFISAKMVDPAAKSTLYATVKLRIKQAQILDTMFEGKTYQQMRDFATQLGTPKQQEDYFDSLGIENVHPHERSRFLAAIKSRLGEVIHKIDTGKVNELVASHPALLPFTKQLTTDFATVGASQEATRDYIYRARAYVEASKELQKQMRIPADRQVHVPPGLHQTLIDTVWNGDANNASRMFQNMGEAFGSQALRSLGNSLLKPDAAEKGTSPKNRKLAALAYLVAGDHSRRELGAKTSELSPFLHQFISGLVNDEKNGSTFDANGRTMVKRAIETGTFRDSPTLKEILPPFDQVSTYTSTAQSLNGVAKAMRWHFGQNDDLSTGFIEMAKSIVASETLSAGTAAGDTPEKRAQQVIESTNKLTNAVARVFTVYAAQGGENSQQVLDLLPTRMVGEGTFDLPTTYSAANAAVLGENMSNALKSVSYWHPRSQWEMNSGLSQIFNNYAVNLQDLFNPYKSSGPDGILGVPIHLQFPWERVIGASFEAHIQSKGDKIAKDYLAKPSTRFTLNSEAFAQYGAWRYNWETDKFEAMLFPGLSSSPASNTIRDPGPAQPLMVNWGSEGGKPLLKQLSFSAEDLRHFEAERRYARFLSAFPKLINPDDPFSATHAAR